MCFGSTIHTHETENAVNVPVATAIPRQRVSAAMIGVLKSLKRGAKLTVFTSNRTGNYNKAVIGTRKNPVSVGVFKSLLDRDMLSADSFNDDNSTSFVLSKYGQTVLEQKTASAKK